MNYNNDEEFREIVKEILDSEDFKRLSGITHHGTTRAKHSLRVSYTAYKMAKAKGLDYVSAARGGLLHDFFFTNKYSSKKEAKEMLHKHPEIALKNAEADFNLNDTERDAIVHHMYPVTHVMPKSKEAKIVSLADKKVAIKEYAYSKKDRIHTHIGVLMIVLFNSLSKIV